MVTCENCGKPLILSGGECIYCHQRPGSSSGTGKEQPTQNENANFLNRQVQQQTNSQNSQPQTSSRSDLNRSMAIKKWMVPFFVAILIIILYMLYSSVSSKETPLPKKTAIERKADMGSYPQDITGNYFVRMMNGQNDVNATIKISKEGSEYAMKVYSSYITKKYAFSYDPLNGEIASGELGRGKVRVKELTNEIEITFEGWELVK